MFARIKLASLISRSPPTKGGRGCLHARRFCRRLATRLWVRPARRSEVRILLFAGRHNLRVNLRQGLGALHTLWRAHHDWPDAVHHYPNTTLGALGDKTCLFACCRDLGARATPPRHRLNGRRLSGCSGRRRSGLCQRGVQRPRKKKTHQS